jgi:hypothetical protein
VVTRPIPRGYISEVCRFTLILIAVAALSACASAVIGPVDHECHGNPARSQGSGCEDMGGGMALIETRPA